MLMLGNKWGANFMIGSIIGVILFLILFCWVYLPYKYGDKCDDKKNELTMYEQKVSELKYALANEKERHENELTLLYTKSRAMLEEKFQKCEEETKHEKEKNTK